MIMREHENGSAERDILADAQENLRRYEGLCGQLPDSKVIQERGKPYYEFTFDDGVKFVTDAELQQLRVDAELEIDAECLKLRKVLFPIGGRTINFLKEIWQTDAAHYVTFEDLPHSTSTYQSVPGLSPRTVIIAERESTDRSRFSGRRSFYVWLHEVGHAVTSVVHGDFPDQERKADIFAVKVLHDVGDRHGVDMRPIIREFLAYAEEALATRTARDFESSFSSADRRRHREEYLALKDAGVDPYDTEAVRKFEYTYRRQMNINELTSVMGAGAERAYDELHDRWVEQTARALLDAGSPRTLEELRVSADREFQDQIYLKQPKGARREFEALMAQFRHEQR